MRSSTALSVSVTRSDASAMVNGGPYLYTERLTILFRVNRQWVGRCNHRSSFLSQTHEEVVDLVEIEVGHLAVGRGLSGTARRWMRVDRTSIQKLLIDKRRDDLRRHTITPEVRSMTRDRNNGKCFSCGLVGNEPLLAPSWTSKSKPGQIFWGREHFTAYRSPLLLLLQSKYKLHQVVIQHYQPIVSIPPLFLQPYHL